MIDGLISLVREIRALAERREKVREDNFTKFVEELYEQFQPVARDYIRLFERVGESASQAKTTEQFDEAFVQFEKERKEFEIARREIEITAAAYGKAFENSEFQDLFLDMTYFFYDKGTAGSMSRSLQERFHRLINRRREIAEQRIRILAQNLTTSIPASYGTPGTYGFGSSAFGTPTHYDAMESVRRNLENQTRDFRDAELNKEEADNRSECIREAVQAAGYSRERWQEIHRKYAELRVKHLLK